MKETFERLVDHLLEGGFFLEEAVEILEKTLRAPSSARMGIAAPPANFWASIATRCNGKSPSTTWVIRARAASRPRVFRLCAGAALKPDN
jgi:hypothetical protein